MRILITADPQLPVPPLLYGGIERVIALLVEELSKAGYNVGLVAHPESTCKAQVLFPWPHGNGARAMLSHQTALRSAVRTFKPDVVHSFSRLLYLLPALLDRNIPKIMSFQRAPTPRTVRWAARIGGSMLSFTGCSDVISNLGRRAGGQWMTIHNFVDVEYFKYSATTSLEAPLVFLSRIEKIKGAHTAIEACRRAKRRLTLAGNHAEDDSDNGRYWKEMIEPHVGRDGIEYVGPVNDAQKAELLGQAAAMIVPIEWEEPFGIVFAEALACGTPVISCPRGALPEIVRDGHEGFLVRSVDDAVTAIDSLPRIKRSDCRIRAESQFSVEAVVPKYQLLYESVICRVTKQKA